MYGRFGLAAPVGLRHIRHVRGKTTFWIIAWVLVPGVLNAAGLEFGFGLTQPALNKTLQPWAVGTSFSLGYVHPVAPQWSLFVGGRYTRYLNDTTSSSSIRFVVPNKDAGIGWRLLDIDVGVQYRLAADRPSFPYLRFLVSNSFWKVWDLEGGNTVSATDGAGNPADLSTQEVLIRGAAGWHYQVAPQVGLAVEAEVSYLSGIGTDFSQGTNDGRSRAEGAIFLKGIYHFLGSEGGSAGRPGRTPITGPYAPAVPSLPPGDSDGDGVPDAVDRCPATPMAAVNWVDAYGCPVDSDRDGVPDYLDRCNDTEAGSPVGEDGCVVDSDGDGVSDMLDRCPDTPQGLKVDAAGCPNYPPLAGKVVFRFNYGSGDAELDSDARAQLLALVPTLKQNPDLQVAIEGFTDNIGPADANMTLAQKRADRVKAFFVGQGIPASQMTASGRGAVDFVGSNDTREGRAQNRRIEITPLR